MTYLIGSDKILCKVESPLIEGWEPCTDIRQLMRSARKPLGDARVPGVRWLGTKIPLEQMKKVLGTVHQFPHTECGFILEYRAEDGAWNIELTEQQGQAAFVRWEDTHQHDGFMSMGTIHTHPEMDAFFSGTDHRNDAGQYGVHIVLGLSEGHAVRTACRIYTPTNCYDQDIWDICEKWDEKADYEPVQAWVDIVNKGIKQHERDFGRIWPLGLRETSGERRFSVDFDMPAFLGMSASHGAPEAGDEDDEEFWEDDVTESDDYLELDYADISVNFLVDAGMDVPAICHALVELRSAISSRRQQSMQRQDSVDKVMARFEGKIKFASMPSSHKAIVKLLESEVLREYWMDKARVCY